MDLNKTRRFVILSMPLYFGWLLSFPYYGPVFEVAITPYAGEHSLFLFFAVTHGLTYLLAGLFIRDINTGVKMMWVGLLATFLTNAVLLLQQDILWLPAMVIFGFSSSLFVLGWCCFYSLFIPQIGRLKIMAAVMILANGVFILFNLISSFLYAQVVLALALLPLFGVGLLLYRFNIPYLKTSKSIKKTVNVPKPLLVIICLFVFALYLNGGLMFRIIIPSMDVQIPLAFYYRFIIYILVLIIMYLYGEKLQKLFSIYMTVSLLGLAFVSFALISELAAGFILTVGLLEAAFAFLDLSVWVTLGSLAFLYKAPFHFFGLALAANLGGIILGDLFGEVLLQSGESIRLMTALFASLSIFIVLFIVPWISRQIDDSLPGIFEEKASNYNLTGNDLGKLEAHLMPGQKLTPREMEITSLIIKGYTNKDIAEKLHVSPNTIKTHLKNIYNKFGIKKKKELIKMSSFV